MARNTQHARKLKDSALTTAGALACTPAAATGGSVARGAPRCALTRPVANVQQRGVWPCEEALVLCQHLVYGQVAAHHGKHLALTFFLALGPLLHGAGGGGELAGRGVDERAGGWQERVGR